MFQTRVWARTPTHFVGETEALQQYTKWNGSEGIYYTIKNIY